MVLVSSQLEDKTNWTNCNASNAVAIFYWAKARPHDTRSIKYPIKIAMECRVKTIHVSCGWGLSLPGELTLYSVT